MVFIRYKRCVEEMRIKILIPEPNNDIDLRDAFKPRRPVKLVIRFR